MEQNKTRKYLKYAIGEIVLVVLGILIALQINNWNENRLERIKEQEMFITLRNNLQTNLEILSLNINDTKFSLNSCHTILELINNKKPMFDSLAYNFHWARIALKNKFSYNGYESLKSVGFDLITNDSLKNEVINLFEMTYPSVVESLNNANDKINSHVQSYYLTHFETPVGGQAVPNNYDFILEDRAFKNIISFQKSMHEWSLYLNEPLIIETNRVISLINKELNND